MNTPNNNLVDKEKRLQKKQDELMEKIRQMDVDGQHDMLCILVFRCWRKGYDQDGTIWEVLRGAWLEYTFPIRRLLSEVDDMTKQFAAIAATVVLAYTVLFVATH